MNYTASSVVAYDNKAVENKKHWCAPPNVVRTLIIIEAIPGGMITSSTNVTFCMLRRRISIKWGSVALRVA